MAGVIEGRYKGWGQEMYWEHDTEHKAGTDGFYLLEVLPDRFRSTEGAGHVRRRSVCLAW